MSTCVSTLACERVVCACVSMCVVVGDGVWVSYICVAHPCTSACVVCMRVCVLEV